MSEIPQTYADQQAQFDERFRDAMWKLSTMITGLGFIDVPEFRELCLKRLRAGHDEYGATMYEWDAKTRQRNVFEEIADAVVYLTSGPTT